MGERSATHQFQAEFLIERLSLMTDYRRNRIASGTYFFMVHLYDRHRRLLVDKIDILRDAVRNARARRPFHIAACVVLPEPARVMNSSTGVNA